MDLRNMHNLYVQLVGLSHVLLTHVFQHVSALECESPYLQSCNYSYKAVSLTVRNSDEFMSEPLRSCN
jgi:hypothetical protein